MKVLKRIIFLVLICVVTSCTSESVSLGTVEYYPSFLWVNAKTTPVVKKMLFDFSEDAKDDPEVFAEFQFADNEGIPIDTETMIVSVDGKVLANNSFRISKDENEKEVIFSFTPEAREGKHQGYLKLINHKLDRIDSQPLKLGQSADVFQWTLEYNKVMNPLAKVLMWICIFIIIALLFWFLILKPIKYPRFPKFRKMVLVKKAGIVTAQFSVNFEGARCVVFANQKQRQGILNKIFTGRIDTIVNPVFEDPITFIPRRQRKAMAKGRGYLINPNPIPQSGGAEINLPAKKMVITLK